jgi:hypothetical protein
LPTINLDPITHDRLRLVAGALNKSECATVAHLLDRLGGQPAASGAPTTPKGPTPIHVVYKGHRVDAEYDRKTQAVTITSGPLAGETFEKPSPAARAVVGLVAPNVNPHRNGWGFWIVTDTGDTLQSIRDGK